MRTLLFSLISLTAFSQGFPEKDLNTSINNVLIYVNSVQVSRTGEASIPVGETILIAKGITPHLDDQSIQVKAEGAFTILAVNHRINYLKDLLGKNTKVDSLKKLIKEIGDNLTLEQAKQEVLKEQLSLLNVNKKLGGENSGVTITQLQQAVRFYESEITKIKKGEIDSKKEVVRLNQEKVKIQKQLNEWNSRANTPSSEIEIRVRAEKATRGRFNISYLARNAGWTPQYDIRVKDIQSPVELNYKAEVYQNTGVDWDNVQLTFSNGNPNQSGTAPRLRTWYLDFQRDFAASKSRMAAPASSEEVFAFEENVAGFGMDEEEDFLEEAEVVTTTTIESSTAVQFAVDIPYSVKSNGERFTVDLSQHSIEAFYEYYAVPKLDRDAFLMARVVDWNQLNLLSGPANLYFEDAYVGKSYLNARNVEDTLDLSLGRDKNIIVTREKVNQFSKKRIIGNNKIESRGFTISIRNTKSQEVKLTVFDQIPVSTNSGITVEKIDLSGAKLNIQSGQVSWELNLDPRQNQELNLRYEVKYPKKQKVILE